MKRRSSKGSAGSATLSIYVHDLAQMFNSLGPLPFWDRDPDGDAASFIGVLRWGSNHPEFAAFLIECGIDSASVSPGSFMAVNRTVAAAGIAGPSCRPLRRQ